MSTVTTQSAQETIDFARQFGANVKPGTLIALQGTLGTGKTTFVKGLALGLGVKSEREVKSPTFVIMHVYKGKVPLYHLDLYRMENSADLDILDEYIFNPDAVSVVEWPERIPEVLNKANIKIEFKATEENERLITIR